MHDLRTPVHTRPGQVPAIFDVGLWPADCSYVRVMSPYYRCVLAGALVVVAASVVEAVPVTVFGRPVTGVASSTGAVPDCPALEGSSCFDTATGSIGFFIPLSTENAGVFGVTNLGSGQTAGTFSDYGGGTENADALTMYLRFSPVAAPAATASMRFDFVDLDLSGVNDPQGFFESVRFYDASGLALTPTITVVGQSSSSPLPFSVTGNSTNQTILFPDIASMVNDPFYLELRFRSSYTGTGRNTIESLIATLTSEAAPPPQQVPEPGTLGLLGIGLVVVAMAVRQPRVLRPFRRKDRAA